ncbi:hypothetical protein MTR67_040714 [Solanum verrucosum]|uniref:Gag-pol polyprotein n=1 Tax=Solanum verrucosum TaxID=315347 RepID=A0AAF0ZSD7_SOLVR|nr:hypothetical protein MTR67_040714 [Solanum verrucosum]
MTIQANREAIDPVNLNMVTIVTRVRDFTRLNPPEFHGLKIDEDPQEFVEAIHKILAIMRSIPVEKANLAAYQLRVLLECGSTSGREGGQLMWVLLIGRNSKGFSLIISFPLR